MADPKTDTNHSRFEVTTTVSDHFGWVRTRLSLERTMMSWVRTATTLIAFGFSIVQFFEHVPQLPSTVQLPASPRFLGLAMIFCGITALISIWEYRWGLRYLWSEGFTAIAGVTPERKQTPLLALAIALTLVGIFAFAAVLLRV